jgi:hypothetical protein
MLSLPGLKDFLIKNPGMTIIPSGKLGIKLMGSYTFRAYAAGHPEIEDTYSISIFFPKEYPKSLPSLREVDQKVPAIGSFHVNEDRTICLGSPIRLLSIVYANPCINNFFEKIILPYFYATTLRLRHGSGYIFGELEHGKRGLIKDYSDFFGVHTEEKIHYILELLTLRPRIANKRSCPCGCSVRIGICDYRFKLNSWRKISTKKFFMNHLKELKSQTS